jgi:hypothetical protein
MREPGWLKRQFDSAERDVQELPEYIKGTTMAQKRSTLELIEALRFRADLLCGEHSNFEFPATAALLREAAEVIDSLDAAEWLRRRADSLSSSETDSK